MSSIVGVVLAVGYPLSLSPPLPTSLVPSRSVGSTMLDCTSEREKEKEKETTDQVK